MNRKAIIFLAAFIPLVASILSVGCSKKLIPVIPTYIPNTPTITYTSVPSITATVVTPPATTGATFDPTATYTLTGSPTPVSDPTPVPSITTPATPPATSTYTNTWTNTPTSDPTPVPTITSVYTPVSTPAAVVRYLVSAPSGYDSGMPVTYRLYCLDWYAPGPVTVVDTFDPGFTCNGPTPADTANGPNYSYGGNAVTLIWPNGFGLNASSSVTFSVVDSNVTASEQCQVRPNQAAILWSGGSIASIYGNDSVTMVCPTITPAVTSDPTPIPTNTWTNTPTSDPTPMATQTVSWVPTFYHTGTPTVTPNPSGIYINGGVWQTGPTSAYASVQLQVNGVAETTASGTVSGPGGTFPLVYGGTYQGFAQYNLPVSLTSMGAYVAGQTYSVSLTTSLGTVTASAMAPGGNIAVTPDGSTLSWDYNGTNDSLYVMNGTYGYTYDSSGYYANATSPFTIPSWAYPGPGTYYANATLIDRTYAVTGAAPSSSFSVSTYTGVTVTK